MNLAETLRKKAEDAKQKTVEKYKVMALRAYRNLKNDLIDCAESGGFSYTTNNFLDNDGHLVCFDADFQKAFKELMTEKGFYILWDNGHCVIDWQERIFVGMPGTITSSMPNMSYEDHCVADTILKNPPKRR